MTRCCDLPEKPVRRGIAPVVVLGVALAILALLFLAADVGRTVLVRSRLQAAADEAAMAAAANLGNSADKALAAANIELGRWNHPARTFTPGASPCNAVRVTARREADPGGLLAHFDFASRASAVAVTRPRDIAFVVDLSGAMNDETEPCWATAAINGGVPPRRGRPAGDDLMGPLYDDLGFGPYPGVTEHVGQPWGIAEGPYAYAELTRNGGPLAHDPSDEYRIEGREGEAERKRKAYSAIIDRQIARIMPRALPVPESRANYGYWEKYLDYLLEPVVVVPKKGARVPGPGTPPARRGPLPPGQDSDRITKFNNPDRNMFPGATEGEIGRWRNRIGYRTYVQFMLDHGRDLRPDGKTYAPTSPNSPLCPWHEERTPGGSFLFPPRTQPVHAVRRALIAALAAIRERNEAIDPNQADWVSIVSFDTLTGGGPAVRQPLGADYDRAMRACTRLEAAGDKAATRATEAGLIAARRHLQSSCEGGRGRDHADKVVVLLTGGTPDLCVASAAQVAQCMRDDPLPEFYGDGFSPRNAALVQSLQMRRKQWAVFAVRVGLGADEDFLDRMARLGGTADEGGHGPRAGCRPDEQEQRLVEVLTGIISSPRARLAQ